MKKKQKKRARHSGSGKPAIDAKAVLRVFKTSRKPLTMSEILRGLKAHKKEKQNILAILNRLSDQGKVLRTRSAWGLTDSMKLCHGTLQVQRSGVGFVIPNDKRRRDIFVSPRNFNDAWHGDKVVVALTREAGKRHAEGRIVRIIERSMKRMPCRVVKQLGQEYFLCQPTDVRQPASFMVEQNPVLDAMEPGQIVVVEPVEKLDRELWNGEVVENWGNEFDVSVQEFMVKLNHNIPGEFPEDVLREAKAFPPDPGDEDFAERNDLRHIPFVTIDGARARDFDDAVYVERKGPGYRLWVAIADVSHYVRPGSALDKEAFERGNSYYFPRSVEPMLPEALSNGLCSLNPDVNRLAVVATIDFDANGTPGDTDFCTAVIKSQARLTYAQVNRAVILKEDKERNKLAHVLDHLELAEELARKINKQRSDRGSLDFDLPEPEIHFNTYGETEDIRPKARHFGHQIIEEFMIAANEAVAERLEGVGQPQLFRIHPEPDQDKLTNLFKVMAKTELGIGLPQNPEPRDIQELLHKAEGTDAEFMVSRLTLRTMMQAKYSPVNEGHFGLASTCYSHFTSPIRRYADLTIHRALKASMGDTSQRTLGFKKLLAVGNHISTTERSAMEAEREILKRLTVLFLQDRVGEEFTGVVNSLAEFGFWVELKEVMAEGLVRVSTLNDDYYTLFSDHQALVGQRTGRSFKLGQKVRVRLEDANLALLEVDLKLID
jgi:ribonuclease R